MNADFLAVLEFWEREKGISRDVLVTAVQDALLVAAKKAVGPARELRVQIDPKNGEIKAFAKLVVSEKVISKHDQIAILEARKTKADVVPGEEMEVEVTPTDFGRIATQYAKQALMQAIRKAEKQLVFAEFKDRVGDIISGTVRRFDRSDVVVDLGKHEALLPSKERVPTEDYQPGERIRCYVKAVEQGTNGPDIILSRADPRFVVKLFQLEVSEINDGTIEIKAVAREPGFRTKMAVYSRDAKVDPVGACVGMRGQRVKNIVRELNNEKVDIISWSADVRTFVTNALAPAQIKAFEMDEPNHRVRIIVSQDQLSLTIGKRGQNARLTSRLTGWHVDVHQEVVVVRNFESQVADAVRTLAVIPGVTPEQAAALVRAGIHTLEDLAQADEAYLTEIPEIGAQAGALLASLRTETSRQAPPDGGESAAT